MINCMPGRVLSAVSVWLLFMCCIAQASLPRANDDRYSTDEDTEVSFNVLLNDFDADIGAGDTGDEEEEVLRVFSYDSPQNGSITSFSNEGGFTYMPDLNFHGIDTFEYLLTDGSGHYDEGRVVITVNSVNDEPEVIDDVLIVTEDTPGTTVDVRDNDSDDDCTVENPCDPLQIVNFSLPSDGTMMFNLDGTFTYTPNRDFFGADSFTYTVSDGEGGIVDGTINVLVIAVNDAPVAVNDNFDVDENIELVQAAPGLLDNDQDEEEADELTAILVDGPTVVDHSSVPQAPGTLQLNLDGSFNYIPPANVNGIATFTYKANDGFSDSNVATVTIDIGERNIDPVARNDFAATPEDTPVEINVLANDTDANDGDQLFVIDLPTVGGAANGQVTFNANGNLTYTPFGGFAGQDTFQYTINDGSGGEDATATVTINVLATTNIPPIATNDSAVTTEDTDVTIPVLLNDLDVDGDTLTIVDFTLALRGQVVLNGDQFVYTPDPDFPGFGEASTDQFTYRITDGSTIVGPATVSLFVSPVNDNPIVFDDLIAAVEDTEKMFPDDDLIDNDSDVDNDSGDLEILSFTQPANGLLTFDPGLGVFTYTPDEGFNGDDTFTYQLWDQRGDPVDGSVTITVAEAPDPPVAADDVGFTPEDTAVTIDVLANDEDPDEETLSISAIAVQPTNGDLVINGGSITYTPAADFFGSDSFDYTIADGNGPLSVDTATVTINVASVNDPPVANNDAYDALSGIQLTVLVADGLLLNDHDIENDVLKAVLVTPPTNGTLLFSDDGSFQYTPGPGFAGDDSFTYRANGGSNDSAPATVTIAVVNQVPFANNDFFSMTNTNDGTGVAFAPGVLANDNDGDVGDVLAAIRGSSPSNGALDFNSDGSFTYTPYPDFEGNDTFTYTADDGLDESAPATVTVTVTLLPTHDPIANDDFYTVAEDATLTVADGPGDIIDGQVDGTGKDSDGDVTDTLVASLGSPPANGSFAFNASGSFTYTPNPDFNGTDTFTYTITDGVTVSNSATVTIEVTPVNDAPNAVNDTVTTTQGEAVDVDVLANDEDVDSDPLSITEISDPVNAKGVVELLGDNKIRFTPAPASVGEDTFTYTIVDGDPGGPATATVTVLIVGIAHTPVAGDDSDGTDEDVALNIAVTTNDTDEDGDILTPAIVAQPANGSVVVEADRTVTYTPTLDFNGTDTFTYTVTDGFNVSDPATVTVDVEAINDLPTAVDDLAVTLQGDPVTISVLNNDTDPENDTLSIAGITQPAVPGDGTIAVAGSTLVFTPAAATTGVVTFTYDIVDGEVPGASITATVTVIVIDISQAPVAANDSYTVDEDAVLAVPDGIGDILDGAVGGAGQDSDADGDTMTALLQTGSANGTLDLEASGAFTYTPDPEFNGQDSFTYVATDGLNVSNIATVTITVDPVDDGPVAGDDQFTTTDGSSVVLDVLDNDEHPDGAQFSISAISTEPPDASGHAEIVNDGQSVSFDALPGVTGTVTFDYTIADDDGDSDIATVSVQVFPQNVAPQALDDVLETAKNTNVQINLIANDTDSDGALQLDSVTITQQPVRGTLGAITDGVVLFTPTVDFTGTATFRYIVLDTEGKPSNQAVVTIEVLDVPPVVAVDDQATANAAATVIDVAANDTAVAGLDTATVSITDAPDNGGLSAIGGGNVTYTAGSGFLGVDTFQYTIADINGTLSNIATVSVTVFGLNNAPIAVAEAVDTNEDTAVIVDVLLNDIADAGADLLVDSIAIVSNTDGTAVANTDGTVTFTPDADFDGAASFEYTVLDNIGETSNTATVTVNVNDAPAAIADTPTTSEDTPIDIDVPANDTDTDGTVDGTSVIVTSQPANGTVAVNAATGVVTYTPDADTNGADTFDYTIADDDGAVSDAGTVTVTVTAVNDAPVAADDITQVDENSNVAIPVSDNDSDVDDALDLGSVVIGTAPTSGVLSAIAAGSVTYTPTANFAGPDSFTYTIEDASGARSDAATVTINVLSLNVAPIASDTTVNTNEDTNVDINLLDLVLVNTGAALLPDTIALGVPSTGSVSVDSVTGIATYTPAAGDDGLETFTYTIDDNIGRTSNTATVTIDINGSPVANDDPAETTDEETAVEIAVLGNDTDDDTIDVTTVTVTSQPANGTATIDAVTGVVTYTPNADFAAVDTFDYTIADNDGAVSNTATVTVTVANVADAPVAVDDTAQTDEGSPVVIDIDDNDTDADSDLDNTTVVIAAAPADGTLSAIAGGNVTYTPDDGFQGTDTFQYTIEDFTGARSNTATVTVTVLGENSEPVAVDITVQTNEDTPASIDLVVLVTADAIATLLPGSINIAAISTGTVDVDSATGFATYTPAAGDDGLETFTYTIDDNIGRTSNTATVTIDINDSPVANDDPAETTDEETAVEIAVLGNDTDDDTIDVTTVTVTAQPANGTATVDAATGVVTYTPSADFAAVDTFDYTIADNDGAVSNAATVTVTVANVADAPVAVDDTVQTDEGVAVDIDLPANDTDADGDLDANTVVIELAPTDGTLTIPTALGSVTYTPNAGFSGTDTLQYTIEDALNARSNTATVTVTVLALNGAPGAVNDTVDTNENTDIIINILANDAFDAAASPQPETINITLELNGAASLDTDTGLVTFTPTTDFSGAGAFSYEVTDNLGRTSNTATVTINVNDAPVANDDGATTTSETAVTIAVLDNDTDSDGTVDSTSVVKVSDPAGGDAVLNIDGTFTYTPDAGFDGIDTFTYTVEDDGDAVSNTATVSVLVVTTGGTATPPTANDDSATSLEDTSIQIDVLANDGGAPDAATVTIISEPANGVAGVNADGSITYTPNQNDNFDLSGADTLQYTVASTGGAFSNIATVTITVTAINDLPVALEDVLQVAPGGTVNIDVRTNDSDVETATAALNIISVSQPRHGTVVNNGTDIDYTPAGAFTGTDTFTYRIEDADGGRATATVTASVAALAPDDATVIIGFDTPRVRHGEAFEALVFVRDDVDTGFLGGPLSIGFDNALVAFDTTELPTPADTIQNPFNDVQPTTGTDASPNIDELKGETNRTGFGVGEFVLYARIPFVANDPGSATFTPAAGVTGLLLATAVTTNVEYVSNSIEIVNFGDGDGDLDVDTADLTAFLAAYPSNSTDAAFDDIFDFDSDSDIDFNDLTAMIAAIGTAYNARSAGREADQLLATVILDRPLAPVRVGEIFQVRVLVQEDSDLAEGFRGGPLDLFFDNDHVQYHGSFNPDHILQPPYDAFLTNGALLDGLVDDLGGLAIQSGLGDGSAVTYAVLSFEATTPGAAVFRAGPGESGFALTPPLGQIDTDEIFYGNAVIVNIEDDMESADADAWTFELNINNGTVPQVSIGMAAGASDLYDPAHDWFGSGTAALETMTADLNRDVRDIANAARWRLRVQGAASEATVISWDPAMVPSGGLLLRQTDVLGTPTGASVGMGSDTFYTVNPGELAYFEIIFGGVPFDLTIASGWNIISIPVEPFDASINAVLQGANTGIVWGWDDTYVETDAITPKNGYWVYRVGASTIITIYGAPVANTTVAVDAGWNLVGPVAAPPYAPVSVDVQPVNALESVIWIYLNGRYQSVNALQPGFGHWLHAGEPATLND